MFDTDTLLLARLRNVSQFVLLFFSSLGLLIVLFASVMLLAGAGSGELPGTLSSK